MRVICGNVIDIMAAALVLDGRVWWLLGRVPGIQRTV
jgi:hypothetical protein